MLTARAMPNENGYKRVSKQLPAQQEQMKL